MFFSTVFSFSDILRAWYFIWIIIVHGTLDHLLLYMYTVYIHVPVHKLLCKFNTTVYTYIVTSLTHQCTYIMYTLCACKTIGLMIWVSYSCRHLYDVYIFRNGNRRELTQVNINSRLKIHVHVRVDYMYVCMYVAPCHCPILVQDGFVIGQFHILLVSRYVIRVRIVGTRILSTTSGSKVGIPLCLI